VFECKGGHFEMASVADVVAVQQPRAAFPHVAALDFLATEGAPEEIFGSAIGHHNESKK